MQVYKVTLIPGDGIGPEVVDAAVRVLDAAGVEIEWQWQEAGAEVAEKHGDPLPQATLDSVRENGVALKGPITTPLDASYRSTNAALRRELDLYSCLRPCRSLAGLPSPYKDVDFVVVRENHEGLFYGVEYPVGSKEVEQLGQLVSATHSQTLPENAGVSLKVISAKAAERILRFGFKYALDNGRKKVTVGHKANVMRSTDGLFLELAEKIAAEYPQLEFEPYFIDLLCGRLASSPQDFDLIVLPNLYGDIAADIGAGLTGGVGLAAGANFGDSCAVFEAGHGSAPKHKGQNKVNPSGMVLSGAMMLRYLGQEDAAARVEGAVAKVVAAGSSLTYDLKEDRNDPTAVGTREFASAVIENLEVN